MKDITADYIKQLENELLRIANPTIAVQQKAYLKHKFDFYGIKTPERRMLLRPFLEKVYLPKKTQMIEILYVLWEKPERDYQMFGLDLVGKYKKQLTIEDLEWMEHMIIHKSWWDTVDFVAAHMIGAYFRKFPKQIDEKMTEWMNSRNIWLQRTCLIFQLQYKAELNTDLLANNIELLLGSKEFFINKAIGWILRDYSKVNPAWVRDFVNKTELSPLSRREALRLIN